MTKCVLPGVILTTILSLCLQGSDGAADVAVLGSPAGTVIPPEMQWSPLPPVAPSPPDNPSTSNKVALGRLLFFDPVLSTGGEVSCATCHDPRYGWGDGRATPIGVGGVGRGPDRLFRAGSAMPLIHRNVPSLVSVGFNGLVSGGRLDPATAPMFWDSRVQGLEQQVFAPIRSREEMRGDACDESEAVSRVVERLRANPEYRERFVAVFGGSQDQAVTAANLAKAVAAFERSLVSGPTPVDRFLAGDSRALNAEQQRGWRAFQDAGCLQCHGGPMFSDFKLHFIGVPDPAPGGQREFRTPSLRGLRHTAPYMHHGGLRTLRSVLIFYDELADAVSERLDGGDPAGFPRLDPLLKRLKLNPDDFPALEAFLDALSEGSYDQTQPAALPGRSAEKVSR